MNKYGLNPRQEIAIREYAIDLNLSRAGRAAGYSSVSAGQSVSRLLESAGGLMFFNDVMEKRIAKSELTADDIIARYTQIITADRRMLVDEDGVMKGLNEIPEELAACIDGYKVTAEGCVEYKLVPLRAALRDMGEMFALFKTIQEVKTQVQITAIETVIVDPQNTDCT